MPQTWVFQSNPSRFDIDEFLSTFPRQFSFLVTRYKDEIAPGDQVFVWRSSGDKAKARAGVIAEAAVTRSAELRPDDEAARPYWTNPEEANEVRHRVMLRLVRVANSKEVLRRDWLLEDPILKNLAVLRMASGTNYRVSPEHAARLASLWNKVGIDWTWADSVAGMWAYAKTYGQPVSRLPDSPVGFVSSKISRAIGGVYNKVMNFRSLDPRDDRAGLDGAGAADRKVWDRFFDNATSSIRQSELDAEFARLWGEAGEGPPEEGEVVEQTTERQAKELLKLSLEELLHRCRIARPDKSTLPSTRSTRTRTYDRSPEVIAYAKVRAGFKCEAPGCETPLFISADGWPFCEVHHLVRLADGGPDTPENVACLCPNHHREIHHGTAAQGLLAALAAIRSVP